MSTDTTDQLTRIDGLSELIERIAATIYEGTTSNRVADWEDIIAFEDYNRTDGMTPNEYRFMAEVIIEVIWDAAQQQIDGIHAAGTEASDERA